jgi:putrescine---pyruvate transaminase
MNAPLPSTHSTAELQAIHAARHMHPFEDQKNITGTNTRVMVHGDGVYLRDSEGKTYLDGMAGLWCTAVGYGRKELVDAAARQMQQLAYYNLFFKTTHPPVIELSEKLFTLLPDSFSRIVYTNSGSEANEVLIRTVRHYWKTMGKPDKKILIARFDGYHGSTMGSASLGGFKDMHEMGDLPIPGITHIGPPNWSAYNGKMNFEEFGVAAARLLEKKILALGADNVAAFVAEPFQGAGGAVFPPASYWPEIQRICRQYDVLLCADEVVGGFGRTGEWFSHQHFGFEPDTLTIAKGLTSGYVPMGGLVLSRRIADALAESGGIYAHGLTYQGHPVAAAVALANLKLLDEGRIVETVKNDTGPYLQQTLREVLGKHPIVGEIHGAGAVASLHLVQPGSDKTPLDNTGMASVNCMDIAFDDGLIVRAAMGRIILSPPLVITRTEIDELVTKLQRALDRTARAAGAM